MLGWYFSMIFGKKRLKKAPQSFLRSNYFHYSCLHRERKRQIGGNFHWNFREKRHKTSMANDAEPRSHGRMVGQTVGWSEGRTVGKMHLKTNIFHHRTPPMPFVTQKVKFFTTVRPLGFTFKISHFFTKTRHLGKSYLWPKKSNFSPPYAPLQTRCLLWPKKSNFSPPYAP